MDTILDFRPKITFFAPEYKIIKSSKKKYSKIVVCNLAFYCDYLDGFDNSNDNEDLDIIRVVTGVAKCSNNDKYDEATGKSIARTKAEMNARKYVLEMLKSEMDEILKHFTKLVDFYDKLQEYNVTDKTYLDSFKND